MSAGELYDAQEAGFPPEAFAAPRFGAEPPPAALVALLARFTYRPRWRFELRRSVGGLDWMLHVTTWVEDAYKPGVWGKGNFVFRVPPFGEDLPADMWLRWLHDNCCQHMESHEGDEWFLVDGVRVFDPHADHEERKRRQAGV